MTRAVRQLEELLGSGIGELPVRALLDAVGTADVAAGTLSDEELALLSPRERPDLDVEFDAPRLSRLSHDQREVALDSALWVLRARGLVRVLADGGLAFTGPAAVIADARWSANARLRLSTPGPGPRHQVHRLRPDLFLSEEITPEGLHHFTFRSLSAEADWLTAALSTTTTTEARWTAATDPPTERRFTIDPTESGQILHTFATDLLTSHP
jgi:hypothetical protein